MIFNIIFIGGNKFCRNVVFETNQKNIKSCYELILKFKYADVDVKPKDIISYMKFIYKVTEGKEDYDSIKYIIENLKELQLLDDFYFVADEFQAIFIDSYFKAEVEDEFVENLLED